MFDQVPGSPAAAVPLPGVDPRIALASTLHVSSTTAALVGSGISRSAGVPTGWEVALDLVTRYARASGVTDPIDDAHAWWRANESAPLRYDTLVPALAPTDAARRDLLRGYFSRDASGQPVQPSQAHRGLARLAADGRLPVIITTNFDHLMEQALHEVGIAPQVLIDPSDVDGMAPVQHAPVTLVKLHGDYATGRLLNDPHELGKYDKAWRRLLKRILGEYGLMVLGWSAEYDVALAQALASTVGRRYAWYWVSYRGQLTDAGEHLVGQRGAHLISADGADAFVEDLLSRVTALEQRASRRRRPVIVPPMFRIDKVFVPGWAGARPLVHVRVANAFHVPANQVGAIDSQLRKDVTGALAASSFTALLGTLEDAHAPALTDPSQGVGAPAGPARRAEFADRAWVAAPDAPQTSAYANYLWGSAAGPGTCARLGLSTPGSGAGEVNVVMDVGLSYVGGVPGTTLVEVLLEAVLAVASDIPAALEGLYIDGGAAPEMTRVELHWEVPNVTGDGITRPVPGINAVHLEPLGDESDNTHRSGHYAESPGWGEPSAADASELVCRCVERVAQDAGHLNPDAAISNLRRHLAALNAAL